MSQDPSVSGSVSSNANNNHPKYKIISTFLNQYDSKSFDDLRTAREYWHSLGYHLASVWFQYDPTDDKWIHYDAYGTQSAIDRIKYYSLTNGTKSKDYFLDQFEDFVPNFNEIVESVLNINDSNTNNNEINANHSENSANSVNDNEQPSSLGSLLSNTVFDDVIAWSENLLPSTLSSNLMISNKDTDNTSNTDNSSDSSLNDTNIDHNSDIGLIRDNPNASDLIVCYSIIDGFTFDFFETFENGLNHWNNLGSWYASVWFIRQKIGKISTNVWVVNESFGTINAINKICKYVANAQKLESWNNTNTNLNNKNDQNMTDSINNRQNNVANSEQNSNINNISNVSNSDDLVESDLKVNENVENVLNSDNNRNINDILDAMDPIDQLLRETWTKPKKNDSSNCNNVVAGSGTQTTSGIDGDLVGSDSDTDDRLCIVCMDNTRDHIIIPCGHICLCQECTKLPEFDFRNSNNDNDAKGIGSDAPCCPICRAQIQNIIKAFM